jgi:hypothetical protein
MPPYPNNTLIVLALGLPAAFAHAQVAPAPAAAVSPAVASAQTVEITGQHYLNGVGSSDAASRGSVRGERLTDLPLLRPGEVLETVPGQVVTQHSGDGKANPYFLRGYNLDHGTDFATFVDGVPVNMPTNAHGQGYTDLNFGHRQHRGQRCQQAPRHRVEQPPGAQSLAADRCRHGLDACTLCGCPCQRRDRQLVWRGQVQGIASTRTSTSDRLSPDPRARWRALLISISVASRGESALMMAPISRAVR